MLHLSSLSTKPQHSLSSLISSVAQAKELLEDAGFAKGGTSVVLGGAIIAGFFAAGCSLPFDFVKTRMQRMDRLPDGSYPYKCGLLPVHCQLVCV